MSSTFEAETLLLGRRREAKPALAHNEMEQYLNFFPRRLPALKEALSSNFSSSALTLPRNHTTSSGSARRFPQTGTQHLKITQKMLLP
jgi:hypothetical protein